MILASLALASASFLTPEATVAAVYAPYRNAQMQDAAWERPIFAASLRALIAQWRAVTPRDEVDDLSDFDWLCQCQDWDVSTINPRVIRAVPLGAGRREVTVTLTSRRAPLRFVLQQVRGQWLIDDLFASGFAGGLRAALVKTIAADIALRKPRKSKGKSGQ